MKQVIELIVKSLVENPDKVVLEDIVDGDNVTVKVKVADGDMGRVIGKGGATVTAIRTILKNCNSRDGKRYFIQIGDEVRAPRKEVQNASY
ncbi:MAG: KH domain-containing protein [Clostridia bacterium]|nr:KH domain-containing protein [Clostridia bacterium]MBS7401391.1 KH domain-containing protein [Eubacteriales bacterium]